MATIGSETEQVVADPANTVVYGGETFVKFTASTYDVELQNGNNLVIDTEKAINEVEDGVPTSIQGGYSVIDSEPQGIAWAPTQNTYYMKDPMLDPTLGSILQVYATATMEEEWEFSDPVTIDGNYLWYNMDTQGLHSFLLGATAETAEEVYVYDSDTNKQLIWEDGIPSVLLLVEGGEGTSYLLDGQQVQIEIP